MKTSMQKMANLWIWMCNFGRNHTLTTHVVVLDFGTHDHMIRVSKRLGMAGISKCSDRMSFHKWISFLYGQESSPIS